MCKGFFANPCLISTLLPMKTRVLLYSNNLIRWLCLNKKADQECYFPKYIFSKKAISQSNSLLFECSVRGNAFQRILLYTFLCEEQDMKSALCLNLLRAAWKSLNEMAELTSSCGTWAASIHSKSSSHRIA